MNHGAHWLFVRASLAGPRGWRASFFSRAQLALHRVRVLATSGRQKRRFRAMASRQLVRNSFRIVAVKPVLADPDLLSMDSLIELLADRLLSGEVVALATDTVFGLVGCAANCRALTAIARIKGRDPSIAMPVLIGERSQLDLLVPSPISSDENVAKLIDAYWPGPLTIVLPLRSGAVCESFFPGGRIGVRLPDDLRLQTLVSRTGPVVATSANKHGKPTLRSGSEVMAELVSEEGSPGLAVVVNEGSRSGIASTIVEVNAAGFRVIREGGISGEAVGRVFGVGLQQ